MAQTALTVVDVDDTGTAESFANADTSNGNSFANDGRTFLLLYNNGSTGSATVTIATAATVDGFAVGDNAITLTTTQRKVAGPFEPSIYNDSSGNVNMTITGTGAADVDLMVIK